MSYTNYYEIKLGKKESKNLLLMIKHLLNSPMLVKSFRNTKFFKSAILSLGCPICCPAVTFNKPLAGQSIFDTTFINSCDYKTWVDLSKKNGSFVYINKALLGHRIYAESATSKTSGITSDKKKIWKFYHFFGQGRLLTLLIRFMHKVKRAIKYKDIGKLKMKIAVTGANGYIGRHVVSRLIDLGHDVVATDLVTDKIDSRAIVKTVDIFKDDNIFELLDSPEVCIHLAWKDGFIHNSDSHLKMLYDHYAFIKKMVDSGIKHLSVMEQCTEVGILKEQLMKIHQQTRCHYMVLQKIP
ncbi:NAD-dependent epimerase/dehydratase family protein [Streptococcus iniae]